MKRLFLAVGLVLILLGCGLMVKRALTAEATPSNNEDTTWLSPGTVEVGNYYPGATAEYPLTLHNGEDKPQAFTVECRKPNRTKEGFTGAPSEAREWVTFSERNPRLQPQETRDITVSLAVPKGVTLPEKWELWISATGETRGMFNIELVSRIFVTSR